MKQTALSVTLLTAAISSHAAVLDFSGDICAAAANGTGPMIACINGGNINQAYGDTAAVNVQFADQPATQSMVFWNSGYSTLNNIAYSASGATPEITLTALGGNLLTLSSFDLGSWQNSPRVSRLQVIDMATNVSLINTGPFNTGGLLVNSFTVNATSAVGFKINFGPDSFYVGIDNVVYSTSPVPELGTWALMAAGLAALAVNGRRRNA